MPSVGTGVASSNTATSVAPVSVDAPIQTVEDFDLFIKGNNIIYDVPPWAGTARFQVELTEGSVGSLAMSIKRRLGAAFRDLDAAISAYTNGYSAEFPVDGENQIRLNIETKATAQAYARVEVVWKPKPLLVYTRVKPPATSTLSNVAASASNVTVLAANANRLGAIVFNDSSAQVYIKFGATASSTSFTYRMEAYSTLEVPFGYYGQIDGIWTSATGSARVTELS